MQLKQLLRKKISERNASIGIVGLGYVGLPLAVAFAEKGFTVIGVDVDQSKIDGLNGGKSHIEDVAHQTIHDLVKAGKFSGTTDYGKLAEVDAISICVPTPLRKTKDPDVSYIIAAAESIAQAGAKGKLIVLESTTYPGTTEEIILPRLLKDGSVVGEDFMLAFSPERIDPGRTDHNMWTTPKVIGGMTADCLEIAMALYGTVVKEPVPVSSPAAAEMVKLLENTFRAVNIGLVNEMALMCDKLGLNVWEIVDAAATKPYGFMKFTPGPGLGGHCIPIDPHYLNWKLKTLNYTARFVELADEINRGMPEYVVNKVVEALNSVKKAVNGSRVLIVGVAYKPNVSDMRESPALDVIHLLEQMGADVVFADPFVEDLSHEGLKTQRVELDQETLNKIDIAVVITNHKSTDWSLLEESGGLIIDTRNSLKAKGATKIYSI
ncbi:MAG: nucleotide sugar dehydrogenase [Anaerolineae bacterium]